MDPYSGAVMLCQMNGISIHECFRDQNCQPLFAVDNVEVYLHSRLECKIDLDAFLDEGDTKNIAGISPKNDQLIDFLCYLYT